MILGQPKPGRPRIIVGIKLPRLQEMLWWHLLTHLQVLL